PPGPRLARAASLFEIAPICNGHYSLNAASGEVLWKVRCREIFSFMWCEFLGRLEGNDANVFRGETASSPHRGPYLFLFLASLSRDLFHLLHRSLEIRGIVGHGIVRRRLE